MAFAIASPTSFPARSARTCRSAFAAISSAVSAAVEAVEIWLEPDAVIDDKLSVSANTVSSERSVTMMLFSAAIVPPLFATVTVACFAVRFPSSLLVE